MATVEVLRCESPDSARRGADHSAMRSVRITLFLLTFAISPVVAAAPCAGFTDVDDTSAFCANVEWVKNRAITLGCTSATSYCPSDPVTRLQMAAFMNRLGTALEPRFRYRAQSNLANNVNAGWWSVRPARLP